MVMVPFNDVVKMADLYESCPPAIITPKLLDQFTEEVDHWFKQIPVPVKWVYDGQPFNSMGQMRRDMEKRGYLTMYAAQSVLGTTYHKHRAVHDYFGHIVHGIPFGVDGEVETYRLHRTMYSPELHHLVFSDVVLNNAYFEANGEFFATEKYAAVLDTDALPLLAA
jgi:hypothetical protein